MNEYDLTICSVSFNSKKFLENNWRLVKDLNKSVKIHWIVIENSPPDSSTKLLPTEKKFQVLEGESGKWIGPTKGSYQHAASLNKALHFVHSRYVLILDPDFFVIKKDWISCVLDHMKCHKLSFFGAPYFPDRINKYRYFPSGICMFIDLKRIPVQFLDFTPEIYLTKNLPSKNLVTLLPALFTSVIDGEKISLDTLISMIKKKVFLQIFGANYYKYWSMGTSRDVGYKIYRAFSHNKQHTDECIVPSWKNPLFVNDTYNKRTIKNVLKNLYRLLLPDGISYLPKKKSYSTTQQFRNFYLPDLYRKGWEEYFWHEKPFGFHIRSASRYTNKVRLIELEKIIFQCTIGKL